VPVEISSSYRYNTNGIRVAKNIEVTNRDTNQLFDKTKSYLIDSRNPTGYAQVLEAYDANGLDTTYTLGHAVLSQSTIHDSQPTTQILLPDGHGSTRLLTDASGTITDRMDYDAYGQMLGGQPNTQDSASTALTYSGEQYDEALKMGYNRARYFRMAVGAWNRVDPFEGNKQNPQSLHNYGYCRGDPVNCRDSSGARSLIGTLAVISIRWLQT
jgi:RHS repeat-associated protein